MTTRQRSVAQQLAQFLLLPLAASIPTVMISGSAALAQPLIDLTPPQQAARPVVSTWVDDVVWRERTDGTPSLVVERILPGSNSVIWELQRGDRVVSYAGVIPESVAELRSLSAQLESQASPISVLRGDRMLTLAAFGTELDPRDSGDTLNLPAPPSPRGLEELPPQNDGASLEPYEVRPLDRQRVYDSRRTQQRTEPSPLDYGDQLDDLGREGYDSPFPSTTMGFRLSDFRADRYRGYDTPVLSGAMVEEVVKGSLADRSGLKAGMIIVAVDGRRIDTAPEVERWLLDRAQETEIALLAYEGRQLRRIRMSLIVSNEEVPESELESLPLNSPAPATDNSLSDVESLEVDPQTGSEALETMALEGESIEDLPAPAQSPAAPSDSEAANDGDQASSRRGVLGGILRRNEERPLSNAARDASIEALQRRIERQQRQLEEQQRELNQLIAELKQLESSRGDQND